MSKLQILIPQYNEDNNTIKPLLDSIAIQQGVKLKEDIEVFIGNDGSDTKISENFLKEYSFPIRYYMFEHAGLAATRGKLQHEATADYIMFCDADDKFISTIALQLIFMNIKKGFDALIFSFVEEHKEPSILIFHDNDTVFVHGKVYRRQFLIDNKIEWNPLLREHQDSAFNVLARTLSKKTPICKIPIYMWCDNPNSICRHDGKYHAPNTWCSMIDSYDSVVTDFMKRGYGEHAKYYAVWCLYATYYEMSHEAWMEDCMAENRLKTYKKIVWFCNKYALLIDNCSEEKEEEISQRTKQVAQRRGKLGDMPSFDEWIENILKIYKISR